MGKVLAFRPTARLFHAGLNGHVEEQLISGFQGERKGGPGRVGDEVDNWSNEKGRTLIEALLIQSRYVCTHGFDSSMTAC